MLSDLKRVTLPPLRFEPAELPEVIELWDEDGERQWALATSLGDAERRAWCPTAPGDL